MERKRITIALILLTFLAVVILTQMTLVQAEAYEMSLSGLILLIFILSYLLAKLYRQEYR